MSVQSWIIKGCALGAAGPFYTELSVVAPSAGEARREFRFQHPEVKMLEFEIVRAG